MSLSVAVSSRLATAHLVVSKTANFQILTLEAVGYRFQILQSSDLTGRFHTTRTRSGLPRPDQDQSTKLTLSTRASTTSPTSLAHKSLYSLAPQALGSASTSFATFAREALQRSATV